MTRAEIIKAVAEKTEMTQKSLKEAADAFEEVVYDALRAGEEAKIMNGVTLYSVHKEAGTARNPMTGATVQTVAKDLPRCKFGKAIKDALNA